MTLKLCTGKVRSCLLKIRLLNASAAAFSDKAPEVPKNLLENVISADKQTQNGSVYDKKPFKLRLEAGKRYSWCLCGKSKNQPLCDGTHKDVFLKIKQRPIRFQVEETKEYWLCLCKQTNKRPFCDGTHKSKFVLESSSTDVPCSHYVAHMHEV